MGLLPAIQVARGDLTSFLRGGLGSGRPARHRLMAGLVTAEVALAVVLLVGAGLLARTFLNLQAVSLGFDPQQVLLAQVTLPESRYLDRIPEQTRVFRRVLDGVGLAPGVESAAYVITPPLDPRGGIGGGLCSASPLPPCPSRNPAREHDW